MTENKMKQIILEIEKNPILYDKSLQDYKDVDKKRDIWNAVADSVGLKEKEVESRWKNVRDGFCKYRRKIRLRSGDCTKTIKEYKYAKMLTFLVPFLTERSTTGNLESDEEELQHEDSFTKDIQDDIVDKKLSEAPAIKPKQTDVMIQSKVTEATSVTGISTKRSEKRDYRDDVDKIICQYPKKKFRNNEKSNEKSDDIALFLESMAESIRRLPACQQAEVKFQIHTIVYKAEMKSLYFNEMSTTSETPSHAS